MSHPTVESLRPLTPKEHKELQRVKRASSELLRRHQRAVALVAVAEGQSRTEAARQAGWQGYETVSKLVGRFNTQGLMALMISRDRGVLLPMEQERKPESFGKLDGLQIETKMRLRPGRFPCFNGHYAKLPMASRR